MQCPSCSIDLNKKKIPGGGIFWQCSGCNGRAATLPLLRRQVDPAFIRSLWQQAGQGAPTGLRSCPCCRETMREIAGPAGQDGLVLDLCRSCQLVWFDAGELASLPPPPPPPEPPPPLPPEVRERLAQLKIEKLRSAATEAPAAWWQWLPGVLGLPVELNQSAVSQRPWYTWSIALLIALISLIGLANLEETVQLLGLIPAQFERHLGLTLISSFFIHAGLLHLAGNLYFFLIFADNVEDFLGRDRFLLLLVAATLLGNAAHILADPASTTPCVGASGGISGILAFYALQFPQARLGLFIRIVSFHGRWLRIPAWLAAIAWVLLQLLLLWLQLAGKGHVSALAHLGGATAGVAFWFWIRHIEMEKE